MIFEKLKKEKSLHNPPMKKLKILRLKQRTIYRGRYDKS